MCKEMPVIPVNRVVDKKTKIGKMEGQGQRVAQGVAPPPKKKCRIVFQMHGISKNALLSAMFSISLTSVALK
jgi:hypothetical protein